MTILLNLFPFKQNNLTNLNSVMKLQINAVTADKSLSIWEWTDTYTPASEKGQRHIYVAVSGWCHLWWE